MKTMTFNHDGLLWRLATFYGPLYAHWLLRDGTDVCTYTKAVLKGLFIVLLIIAGCSIVGGAMVDALMWAVVMLMTDVTFKPSDAGIIGIFFFALVAVVLWVWGCYTLYDRNRHRLPSTLGMPGALEEMVEMYDAWKSKYCARVTFRDKDAA